MEGASFYTQLAMHEVTAILESIDNHEKIISGDIQTSYGDLAVLLIDLYANLLGKDKESGLLAVKGAMTICEELVATHPHCPLKPALGLSVRYLPIHLSEAGMHDEALKAGRDVVDIHRKLANNHPDTSGFELAEVLFSLSGWLHGIGKTDEALNIIEEIAELCEDSTEEQPAAPSSDPTGLIDKISTYLSGVEGNPQEVVFAQRSVDILKRLAKDASSPYRPILAGSLRVLSSCLDKSGDREAALTAIREAVYIHREIPGETGEKEVLSRLQDFVSTLRNLDPFGQDLPELLVVLSKHLVAAGKRNEAIAVATEAVRIRRMMKRRNMPRSKFALAQALHELYKCLTIACKWHEALQAIREAASLDTISYRPALRRALYNLFRHNESSRDLWREALTFENQTTEGHSDVYTMELDQALRDAFDYYKAQGRWDDALNIAREAASRNPDKYNAELDQAEYDAFNYYKAQEYLGWDKALNVIREAAKRNPNDFSSELDQALLDAFDFYKAKDWWAKRLDVIQEAAGRNLDKYNAELDLVLRDAFDYYKAQRRMDKALNIMREAQRRNPYKYNAELDQATRDAFDYYKAQGWLGWDKALDVMREAAERNPDDFSSELDEAIRDAFSYYKVKGWWDKALDVVQEAARRNLDKHRKELDQAVYDAFDYYKRERRWNEALVVMQEAANRDPDKFHSKLDQAVRDAHNYYKAERSWDEAINVMRKAASRDPDKFSVGLDRAVRDAFNYFKLKHRWDEALRVMQEAVSRSPDKYDAELEQAVHDAFAYYKANARRKDALRVMRDAARRNPDVFDPLLKRALDDVSRARQQRRRGM